MQPVPFQKNDTTTQADKLKIIADKYFELADGADKSTEALKKLDEYKKILIEEGGEQFKAILEDENSSLDDQKEKIYDVIDALKAKGLMPLINHEQFYNDEGKAITKYMSVFLYITFFFLLLIYCKAVIRINKNNIIIKLIIMTITSLYYYITKTSIYLKTLALFYIFNKYIDKLRIDANRTHKRYGI